jgi:hypothetical protein
VKKRRTGLSASERRDRAESSIFRPIAREIKSGNPNTRSRITGLSETRRLAPRPWRPPTHRTPLFFTKIRASYGLGRIKAAQGSAD